MPQRRTEAQAVIQHNAFIDERRRAEAQQEHQRPAVALARVRHPQQEQRREQIPLVHLDAEHIQQHKQHAAAQGEVLQFAAADEHGQHHHKRQRHGDKPHHCEAGIEGRQAEENQREGQPSGDFRRIPVRLLAFEEHHAKRNCARQSHQTHDQQRCAGKHHAAAQMENHRARPAALRREEAAQPEATDNQQNRHQPRQHVGLPAAFLRAVNQQARPDERQRHQQQRNRTGRFHDNGRPVAAEEIVEIRGVDRRVRVGRKRLRVLVNQPRDAALVHAERQDDNHRRHKRQSHADEHRFPALAVADERHHNRRQTEEAQHQRLRLYQHGEHVNRHNRHPVAADGEIRHQHQQQAQHAVNLAPARTVEENGGVERHQQHQNARLIGTGVLLARNTVGKHRCHQIARHRDELVHRSRGQGQNPHQRRVQAHDVDIRGRIIAEVCRLVEIRRADAQQRVAPREEAVYIHLIAADAVCDNQPRRCRDNKPDDGKERHGFALLCIQRNGVLLLQEAQQIHAQRHIRNADCRHPRPRGGGSSSIRQVVGWVVLHRGCRHNALRRRIDLHQRQIIEHGCAEALAAVPAQTRIHSYFVLIRVRHAVEFNVLPLVRRIVYAF